MAFDNLNLNLHALNQNNVIHRLEIEPVIDIQFLENVASLRDEGTVDWLGLEHVTQF